VVSVTVSVDDVFQVETLVFKNESYCVDVEAGIDNCCLSGSLVSYDVGEVVASILDLLKEHENQPSKSLLFLKNVALRHDAYKKEFWTMKKETRTEHANAIKLSGNMRKIRWNGSMVKFETEKRP